MAEEESADIGFEEQLRMEEAEKQRIVDIASGKIKVDDDGTVYDWDEDKKAWFPRVDEDFLARYQLNYGEDNNIPPAPPQDDPAYADWYFTYMVDTNSKEYKEWYENLYGPIPQSSDTEGTSQDQGKADFGASGDSQTTNKQAGETQGTKRKGKEEPAWFDASVEKNRNVYVSGLPSTITDDQFMEFMLKCGLIMFDPHTRKPKAKLYRDSEGNVKGDGRCCYIKTESVDLALKILDGYNYDGHIVSVEEAHFEMKGAYDPSKKKRKLSKQEKKKLQEREMKLFDWRPDKPRGARYKFERTIVIKNLFKLAELDADPLLLGEIQEDLRKECGKFGEVNKLTVYDTNPEGVATVMYAEAEQADLCKEAMHGRYFAKRQVTAETWDGKTKYKVEESEEEQKKRLERFETFIESDTKEGNSEAEKKEEEKTEETVEAEDREKTPPLDEGDSDGGNSIEDELEGDDEEEEEQKEGEESGKQV